MKKLALVLLVSAIPAAAGAQLSDCIERDVSGCVERSRRSTASASASASRR